MKWSHSRAWRNFKAKRRSELGKLVSPFRKVSFSGPLFTQKARGHLCGSATVIFIIDYCVLWLCMWLLCYCRVYLAAFPPPSPSPPVCEPGQAIQYHASSFGGPLADRYSCFRSLLFIQCTDHPLTAFVPRTVIFPYLYCDFYCPYLTYLPVSSHSVTKRCCLGLLFCSPQYLSAYIGLRCSTV